MWFWRLLPFIGRTLYLLELQRRDERIADLERDRDYWQRRAEELIDAGLARAGAIHQPTMVDRKAPVTDVASMIAGALAVQEIDSSKQKKGAT